MSRFNCKVVEAIPVKIEVYEIEPSGILFYQIRDLILFRPIERGVVEEYLKLYHYTTFNGFKKRTFANFSKIKGWTDT